MVPQQSQTYFYYDVDKSTQGLRYVLGNVFSIFPVTGKGNMEMVHILMKAKELLRLKQEMIITEAQLCQLASQRSLTMFNDICPNHGWHAQHSLALENHTLQPSPHNLIPENQSWQTIKSDTIYSEDSELAAVRVSPSLSSELNLFVAHAIYQINSQELTELIFKKLTTAMIRYNGADGREVILDLELLNLQNKTVHRRVQFQRPPGEIVSVAEVGDYNAAVHVIVPISNVKGRFSAFLKAYITSTKHQRHIKLILVVYGRKEFKHVSLLVAKYTKNTYYADITILKGVGEFSRGRAMDQGLSKLENGHLAFLCDVDITIDDTFWNRCKLNAVQGKRVYYPVFFSLYNMEYVYHKKIKPDGFWISREHGHWVWYSYGMVCIYKSDYLASGGFDTTIVGWGGEDTDFFEKVLKAKLEVIKAPDPSLIHRWHPKDCSPFLNPQQYYDCLGSKAEALAGKKELAEYIFHQEEQHNLHD